MPDWLTHTLVGWITGKALKLEVGLVVIGSLIPDLVKIYLAFEWLEIPHYYFFDPLHTPVGALLVGGILALLFEHPKRVFLLLGLGIATHFILDFFLFHLGGGIRLLFPLSWQTWQVHLIRSDDYQVTIVAIFTALLIYGLYWWYEKRLIYKEKKP